MTRPALGASFTASAILGCQVPLYAAHRLRVRYTLDASVSSPAPLPVPASVDLTPAPLAFRLSLSRAVSAMGKSQSKLSPEQLADLQKHTYCACVPSLKP